MGVWIGALPSLVGKLNRAQSLFEIFEVQAAVPAGLVKTAEGLSELHKQFVGKPMGRRLRAEIQPQLYANEFFVVGEDIRVGMNLDYLVGLTPLMVAGSSRSSPFYCNHITSVFRKTIVLSTADLRDFARQAGRTFEAVIGAVLIPALMIAENKNLYYHDDTGCLFDYNETRVSLIPTVKSMRVDDSCLDQMTTEQREAFKKMVAVLKRLKVRHPPAPKSSE